MEQTIGPSPAPDHGTTARRAAVSTATAMHERVEYHTAADRRCALQLRLQPQLQSVQHSDRQRRDGSTQASASVQCFGSRRCDNNTGSRVCTNSSVVTSEPFLGVPAPTSNGTMAALAQQAQLRISKWHLWRTARTVSTDAILKSATGPAARVLSLYHLTLMQALP